MGVGVDVEHAESVIDEVWNTKPGINNGPWARRVKDVMETFLIY